MLIAIGIVCGLIGMFFFINSIITPQDDVSAIFMIITIVFGVVTAICVYTYHDSLTSVREHNFRSTCVQSNHGQLDITSTYTNNLTKHDHVTCILPNGQKISKDF